MFYAYRTEDGVLTPACLETDMPYDRAVRLVRYMFSNAATARKLEAVRREFRSAAEVLTDAAEARAVLSSVRVSHLSGKIPAMASLRRAWEARLEQLERTLEEWQ